LINPLQFKHMITQIDHKHMEYMEY
jgi:hypothetical protein